jgi:hypothetical protein
VITGGASKALSVPGGRYHPLNEASQHKELGGARKAGAYSILSGDQIHLWLSPDGAKSFRSAAATRGSVSRRITIGFVLLLAVIAIGAAGTVIRDKGVWRGRNVDPAGGRATDAAKRGNGSVAIPHRKNAIFSGDRANWRCVNADATSIGCVSGKAEPYATLSKARVLIRIVSVRRPCVRRVYRAASRAGTKPYYLYIYTFGKFGCR